MSVVDLINYLRLEGPHDLKRITTANEEDAPASVDKLTDEEGDSKEEGDDPIEAGSIEEEDPKKGLEEDPGEGEPTKDEDLEEDPEEDPSEGEPMEEEDPEEDPQEDPEVSEGWLMGNEELKGDFSECEMEHIEKENPEGDKDEGRRECIR